MPSIALTALTRWLLANVHIGASCGSRDAQGSPVLPSSCGLDSVASSRRNGGDHENGDRESWPARRHAESPYHDATECNCQQIMICMFARIALLEEPPVSQSTGKQILPPWECGNGNSQLGWLFSSQSGSWRRIGN